MEINRLFGIPGSEQMYLTLDDAYEAQLDGENAPGSRYEIEEWTVADTRSLLPSAERVAEYILESADLVDEYWFDDATNAFREVAVLDALEDAICLAVKSISYRMADDLVDTHEVTFGEHGDPLINGKHLYQIPNPPTEEAK